MMTYPTLFESADAASNRSQWLFLALIRLEYGLLIVTAFFSLGWSDTRQYFAAYAIVFALSMVVMAYRSMRKPERTWYQARALSESVKTLSWRFAMRAEPFDDAKSSDARRDFRNMLSEVLKANRSISDALSALAADGEQLPGAMREMREKKLEERRAFYLQYRIADQRAWYQRKAKTNSAAAKRWLAISCVAYGLGLAFILTRVVDPTSVGWPTEPLVVFASAAIGWTQIKKFNELAAAYTLTAQDIGLVQSLVEDTATAGEFSAAVNEAELAFSREHTQWAARQLQGN
jgi:SMODS and SLOG-associating 2TM effector domain 3/SMODS and SLOG-associating 2TM effector domain 1